MIGLAISNYTYSTTTVITTTILYPIPGTMPRYCKFAKVDIAYGRFHMEATPFQGQSPPPSNDQSLPDLSDRTRKLPLRLRAFTDRPHTGTDDTCSILPGWPLSGTRTKTP